MQIQIALSAIGSNRVALVILGKEDEFAKLGIKAIHRKRQDKLLFRKGSQTLGEGFIQEDTSVILMTDSKFLVDTIKEFFEDSLILHESPELVADVIKNGRVKSTIPYVKRNKDKFEVPGLDLVVSDKAFWRNKSGNAVFTLHASRLVCSTIRFKAKIEKVFDSVRGLSLGEWNKSYNIRISYKAGSGIQKLRHKLLDTFLEKSAYRTKVSNQPVQISVRGLPDKSIAWMTQDGFINAFLYEEGSQAIILGAKSQRTFNKLSQMFRTVTNTHLIGKPSTYKNRKRIFKGEYIVQKIGKK